MTGEVEVEVFIAHMTGVKLLWGVHKIVEGIEKKGGGEGGRMGERSRGMLDRALVGLAKHARVRMVRLFFLLSFPPTSRWPWLSSDHLADTTSLFSSSCSSLRVRRQLAKTSHPQKDLETATALTELLEPTFDDFLEGWCSRFPHEALLYALPSPPFSPATRRPLKYPNTVSIHPSHLPGFSKCSATPPGTSRTPVVLHSGCRRSSTRAMERRCEVFAFAIPLPRRPR